MNPSGFRTTGDFLFDVRFHQSNNCIFHVTILHQLTEEKKTETFVVDPIARHFTDHQIIKSTKGNFLDANIVWFYTFAKRGPVTTDTDGQIWEQDRLVGHAFNRED